MSDSDLLPANATRQERAMALSVSRLSAVPTPLRDLWNPDTCPAETLPWLAWAFGVDEWDSNWPDEFKRATIRDSVLIQSRKGTVWSIRRALSNAGYGDATLYEGLAGGFYDGVYTHDATNRHGDPTQWASYRAILTAPITNTQAAQVRRLLALTAPARCVLTELNFTEVSNLYSGAITYDGAYNHGTA